VLAPDSRVVLLDQLRPPLGYRLDAAVATTFTLDLAAAVVPPLAFASFEMRGTPDPVAALEAVRSCADRVDVFCQAGQIRIPAQASDLMAYLETMIHEVRRPRPGRLFHPKIWFLRYTCDGEPDQYRLLCSTRNLTGDRSWDAVVRLDGYKKGGPAATNRPLAALIEHLPRLAVNALPEARVTRIAQLAEDARRIEWLLPDDVTEIALHAFGLPRTPALPDFRGYRHLIVSPFCNDEGIATLTPTRGEVTLISRNEDLDRLDPKTLAGIPTYVLDPLASLADPDDTGNDTDNSILTGLHAKIVVVERNRKAHVFVGSANATSAAFSGNVEFGVELMGGATRIGVDAFLADSAPFRQLLEPYSATGGKESDPADEALRALENLLRDLASEHFTLTIGIDEPGYQAVLGSRKPLRIPQGFTVTAELLTVAGKAAQLVTDTPASATFRGVAMADLTPFIALRATGPTGLQRGTVVRATLINEPPGRLEEILARQVDSPEKFLRFLALLLGLVEPGALLAATGEGNSVSRAARGGGRAGVLELVLRALADQPESLRDLDRLVEKLQATEAGRTVLPPGFETLWRSVKNALEATLKGSA
jgi:hypothetical protein